MPEKPVPENDPLVQKSLATWYVVCMVLLMASLFWALWDEAFGQRPWKAYQHEWVRAVFGIPEDGAFHLGGIRKRS